MLHCLHIVFDARRGYTGPCLEGDKVQEEEVEKKELVGKEKGAEESFCIPQHEGLVPIDGEE